MSTLSPDTQHLVAVVGAGPAGLFAARELAAHGVHVVMFNRDIKPGGLAEYGIYPDKLRMKAGLREQFYQTLASENIEYYGNVTVGREVGLSLQDLHQLGFQAVLVTVGAQGTKWLGLPGENLAGVYHAKDLVYHYNGLPPYSQRTFKIGKRVVLIGVGNVMLDITHYLIDELKVDEVIAIARRGPGEIKFDRNELATVISNLDMQALDEEFERVAPVMSSLGENPSQPKAFILSALPKATPGKAPTRFRLKFLLSPTRILGDSLGRVIGLECEQNTLVMQDGEIKSQGLGTYEVLDVDTVIFAIGDNVDENIGLPVERGAFVKSPTPLFPIEGISYELYDIQAQHSLPGMFVAGWSRQASRGLVGVARKDGTSGARALLEYLHSLPSSNGVALQKVHARIQALAGPVIDKDDLVLLRALEMEKAAALGQADFRYRTNEDMLDALQTWTRENGSQGAD
ncbi:MAG: FAD-dependent oxidoreductase, partial [Chloroflexi bacterium]|nr:FAD-dependent oxidoreductase [Chloroflexota bacterium]